MKQKMEKIIREIVRNEAISTDKLKKLAVNEGLNKNRITYVMRQAGIIKIMGQGVYQVLRNEKGIEDFITCATEIMEQDIAKRSQKKQGDNAVKAEADIDIHAKLLDMLNTHMEQVKTNTNKQNEYIATLEKRIENLNEKVVQTRLDEASLRTQVSELIKTKRELEKRIEWLEIKLKNFDELVAERIERLEQNYDAVKVRLDVQIEHIAKQNGNGVALKALHQLLGELV